MRPNQERQTTWQPHDEASSHKPTIVGEYIIPPGFPLDPHQLEGWLAKWDLYHDCEKVLSEYSRDRCRAWTLRPLVARLLPIMTLPEVGILLDADASFIVKQVIEYKVDVEVLIEFDRLVRDKQNDPRKLGRTLGLSARTVSSYSSLVGRVPSAAEAVRQALTRTEQYSSVSAWARAMAHQYSPLSAACFEQALRRSKKQQCQAPLDTRLTEQDSSEGVNDDAA